MSPETSVGSAKLPTYREFERKIMGPVEAVKTCFANYATFSGRATRSEFWWFYAFCVLSLLFPLIGPLIVFAAFIPFLAACWRRMHDAGSGGALILAPLALQVTPPYIFLFVYGIRPAFKALNEINGSDDMTVGELRQKRLDAVGSSMTQDVSLNDFLPTLIVVGIGFAWMVYLLTRPSDPATNEYGPNPHEVNP